MNAADLCHACLESQELADLFVRDFVDTFRRSNATTRSALVASGPLQNGRWEGLVSAVVSALCRETATPVPGWVFHVKSPEPFFAFPAQSYAMRVRLMLESPVPFRMRNVFVPSTYLSRA